MTNQAEYIPPRIWTWNQENGGAWASINRPVSGPTHDMELPVGRHPLQLYSLGTPNGVKVTVMLEELLALGHAGAEYDAWLIMIGDGDQFSSGFVSVNPNSKIPALLDRGHPSPVRVFESGAILMYLAEKFGAFLPTETAARAECLSWLFWQMGSAPYLGGGFGHFYAYAPTKIEYAIDRFAMEVKRQLDVLDKRLADNEYLGGSDYTIADMAVFPWYGGLVKGWSYDAAEFLQVQDYKHVQRWADTILERPAVRRGRMVNRVRGEPSSQLHERHDASDFETKTQDKRVLVPPMRQGRMTVKITAIETLRTAEFANVIWVRIHTNAGVIGLGETFYGAGAVEAHIHDTLAGRLLNRNPLHIEALHREMLNLPMAQSSTGAEYRSASAVDIALWDVFGKVCNQPVHQMLGGLCRPKQRIYNTCAGYGYVRSNRIKPVSNWNRSDDAGPYEDLHGFMTRADAVAESLLESGITAMKIWPFDPAAIENDGMSITPTQLKAALEPFEKIRRAVGDKMEIMVEFHSLWNLPMAKKLAKALEPYNPTWFEDPIRMNSPQALAEYARNTSVWVCASETLGGRFPYKDMLDRDAMHVVMADLCWTGGLTEGRKIAAMADTYHRPFAPHDCIGPVGFIAGIHASFSQPNTLIQEGVRAFYTGWYNELVTTMPVIADGYVSPMEGPGLGTELLPAVFERPDLTVRRSEA